MSDDNYCAQELANQEPAIPHGQESGAPNRKRQELRIPPSVCACGFSGLDTNGLVVTLDQLIASSETV